MRVAYSVTVKAFVKLLKPARASVGKGSVNKTFNRVTMLFSVSFRLVPLLFSVYFLDYSPFYIFVHARKSGIDTVKKARKKPLITSCITDF